MFKSRLKSLHFFAFVAVSAGSILTAAPFASAQFGSMLGMGGATASDESGLSFNVGFGLTRPIGEAFITTAKDLDKPDDKDSNDVQFKGSLGTVFNAGLGFGLGGGINLGVEGNYARLNFDEKNVKDSGTDYESDASVSSLGGLLTATFDLDLADQFAISPMVGVGYFQNTAKATIKETDGGVTTEKKYEQRRTNGLGWAAGIGASLSFGDGASVGIGYRYFSPGKANTDYVKGSSDNAVIGFGRLSAHTGMVQANIKF